MPDSLPGLHTAMGLAKAAGAIGRGLLATYSRAVAGTGVILNSHSAPVGLTPHRTVWNLGKARLLHYRPTLAAGQRHRVPLLLVYALINKPFIFDLAPGRSFVEHMVERGFDVYLLDWGAPGPEERTLRFDDYATQYLTRAVRRVLRLSGSSEISIMGYCLGATLSALYAAVYPEAPLRNLILLTPPLDFAGPAEGSMVMWIQPGRLDVDRLVDSLGNIPGELIREWAKLIKPMENYVGTYAGMFSSLNDPASVQDWQAINRWVEDVVPVAGEAFRQFTKDYVWDNKLMIGKHRIDGRRVDPANIRASLLVIAAQHDHLVAPAQAEGIMPLVASQDKTYRLIPSTHVGIMASRSAKGKLWPEVADWLAARSG